LKIPKKITPCPIIEAIVELRFEHQIQVDMIPGIVFGEFKEHFPQFSKLPVMQLPSAVRDGDPNFKFSPYFRFAGTDFLLQVGPTNFSIVCPKEYKGWTTFRGQIETVFSGMKKLKIIGKPIRLGVRYISFFEGIDIFEKVKTRLEIGDRQLVGNASNVLRTEFKEDGFTQILQITNNAMMNEKNSGSMIDIDIVSEARDTILSNYLGIIDNAHDLEKKLYFGMLKEDFLAQFKPEY
jgi:uncharacterized protein (TIGR04255 family)